MTNFKVGKEVKRVNGDRFTNGDLVNTVERIGDTNGEIWLKESGTWLFPRDLVLVKEYPNPPHKHRDLIIEWSNGAEIEIKRSYGWQYTNNPSWGVANDYRIKPQKPDHDIEIESIQKQMDELKERLEKLKGE